MFRRICFAVLISSTLAASASAQTPPTVSAALSPASAAEGTRFRLTITRTGDMSAGSRVSWSLSGAVDAADFGAAALPSGVSGFSPGQKTKIVNLQTVDDAEAEADETFAVTLAALSVGYALGGRWADRGPRLGRFAILFGLAGLWTLLIPFLRTP